jgi:hypothetical protein
MTIARRSAWPFTAVALVAVLLGVVFLQEPKLGDDFTYWRLAFELHDHVGGAWSVKSFHALRWPVWGLSWLAQSVIGPGLISFYCVPLFYLALGAMLAFGIARRAIGSEIAGWCAAIALIFSPLIDSVVYRPMPDMSEGVLGAALVCAWLALMHSTNRGKQTVWAALGGLLIALVHANRFTGLLTIPLLALLTLLFFPRRFARLVLVLVFAAGFIAVECAVYHSMTGDWLHSLHANMSARGKKGTESIALWRLPLRFIDTLFKGNRLATPFMLATIAGGFVAWRRHGQFGRIVVGWAGLLYLGYSCAIQSVHPIRPMLRDADRFLGSLAVPFAVLIAAALVRGATLFRQRQPALAHRFLDPAARRPWLAGIVVIILLCLITSRAFFERGYIAPFRAYLAARPNQTQVFTHRPMRAFAFLMSPGDARRLEWFQRAQIIEQNEELERAAARADEFWYIRKLAWLRQRKEMLADEGTSPITLGSYFDRPQEHWKLNEVLSADDNPEFIFYRKRQPSDPPPRILQATDLVEIVPHLPAVWDGWHEKEFTVPVPRIAQNRLVQLHIISSSNTVQPLSVRADFVSEKKPSHPLDRFEVKPHVYPTAAKDFYAFRIPAGATACDLTLQIEKGVKRLELLDVEMILE